MLAAVRRVTMAFLIALTAVAIYTVAFQVVYSDRGDVAIVGLLFSGVYTVAWISIHHWQEIRTRRTSEGEHAAHGIDAVEATLHPTHSQG